MVSTNELIEKIYDFCEALSGNKLFPYQSAPAKRIIRSLLDGDGEVISCTWSRQSGKSFTISLIASGLSIILPILANMPMFANDKRLQKFRTGFSIGIFAPALHQSQIIFGNIKKNLASDSAAEICSDPEIAVGFSTFNGQNVTLKFNNLGISSVITCMSASDNSNIVGSSFMLIICDESQDIGNSKYMVSISPMGAFYNATHILIGTPSITRGFFYDIIEKNRKEYEEGSRYRNHFEYNYKTIIKYNENYMRYIEKEKKKLGETSDEFRLSYTLDWIFERGMFIDPTKFDRILDNNLGRVFYDKGKTHIAGIDLGKAQDSTVITIGEVDLDNPTIVEENEFKDVPSYVIYDVIVKDWLEITGDNWDEQYYAILEYLNRFKITRVVMDATSVGSHMYDRLNNAVPFEVVPFVFSSPSKSDLYKNFDSYIKNNRYHVPADDETRETHEFKNYHKQMLDLEKTYNGQYMVCKHPPIKTGRDDYCDSSALMVWGAKGEITTPVCQDNNPFLQTKYQGTYNARNKFTGRRR